MHLSINKLCITKIFFYQSTGTGRTGSFIALDYLHKTGKKSGRVNVAEYVKTMRRNRMNMIENCVSNVTTICLNDKFSEICNLQDDISCNV